MSSTYTPRRLLIRGKDNVRLGSRSGAEPTAGAVCAQPVLSGPAVDVVWFGNDGSADREPLVVAYVSSPAVPYAIPAGLVLDSDRASPPGFEVVRRARVRNHVQLDEVVVRGVRLGVLLSCFLARDDDAASVS